MKRGTLPYREASSGLNTVRGVLWRPPTVSRCEGVAGNPPSWLRAPGCGYNVPTMTTQRSGLVPAGDYTLCDVMCAEHDGGMVRASGSLQAPRACQA